MQGRHKLLYMVFDVESVGLHGEPFAVGWVVVNLQGDEVGCGRLSCGPLGVGGTRAGYGWVEQHAPTMQITHEKAHTMRSEFWAAWLTWRGRGATLAADVPWPVEAKFLLRCVNDVRPLASPDEWRLREAAGAPHYWLESPRECEGPYPLLDVASVRFAAGIDPAETAERLPNELPAHDPLADARQSARLLLEALKLAREGKRRADDQRRAEQAP